MSIRWRRLNKKHHRDDASAWNRFLNRSSASDASSRTTPPLPSYPRRRTHSPFYFCNCIRARNRAPIPALTRLPHFEDNGDDSCSFGCRNSIWGVARAGEGAMECQLTPLKCPMRRGGTTHTCWRFVRSVRCGRKVRLRFFHTLAVINLSSFTATFDCASDEAAFGGMPSLNRPSSPGPLPA